MDFMDPKCLNMEGALEPSPTSSVPEARPRTPRPRTYSKHVLPSNRHPFSVHFEVLKRFVTQTRNGAEGMPASKIEGNGIQVQAASMNVRFMRSIGLLTVTDRGLYIPTPEAIRFVRARSVGDDRARPVLASLLSTTWFADLAQRLLNTQPVMAEDRLLGELALAAETDKTKEEPALRVVLDYLIYAGIVNRDERGLTLGSGPGAAAPSHALEAGASPEFVPGPVMAGPAAAPVAEKAEAPGWHILTTEDFHVRIRSDPDVVEDLLAHLGTLQRKIMRVRARAVQLPAPASPPVSTATNPEPPGPGVAGKP